MSSRNGKCLCGAVSVTAETVETHFHACHCSMCRRWAGGPVFVAPGEGVSFGGEENVAVYDSSKVAERGFCKSCGSNLFYRLKETGQYYLSVGIFDDPSSFVLKGEIYIDHKPDGYAFEGPHPRLTEEEFLAQFASPEPGDS